MLCVVNLGPAVPLPAGYEVLLASADLEHGAAGVELPTDTAAWLRRTPPGRATGATPT
ncbi:hypothetical protein D3C74_474590 [compost metagenome]